jgi:uncharacterized protein (DUF1501 family)
MTHDPPSLPGASRRRWLQAAGALAGAGGLLGWPGAHLALAAGAAPADPARADRRLVVVMLRGALDGLAVVPPVGDPGWAALRPPASATAGEASAPLPLDTMFALHPALPTLHRWYGEGQLLVAHATATPYRERSHFDAQQLLESGGARAFERDTGWLARALQASGGQAVAMTSSLPVGLRGATGATSWAPTRARDADDDLLERMGRVLAGDPALGAAFEQAREQRRGTMADAGAERAGGFAALARQAGRFLAADRGPAVAWLESSGWDTHTAQAPRLARLLPALDQGLGALREALGSRWTRTTVVIVTEFGRSAAMNGSGGTDHGTAGVAWLAGGAVHGGRVRTDWPGLGPRDLLDGRDLRPTQDLRGLFKAVVERQFGLGQAAIEREVLPGAPPAWEGLWTA